MSSGQTDFTRRIASFVDPYINRDSSTGIKRLALEVYEAGLGAIPKNCTEHQLGGGAAVLECHNLSARGQS